MKVTFITRACALAGHGLAMPLTGIAHLYFQIMTQSLIGTHLLTYRVKAFWEVVAS